MPDSTPARAKRALLLTVSRYDEHSDKRRRQQARSDRARTRRGKGENSACCCVAVVPAHRGTVAERLQEYARVRVAVDGAVLGILLVHDVDDDVHA
jgi:hypothetical protein